MHITRVVSRICKLFIPSSVQEIAKSSGFMKRQSKLLPETFAKVMSLGLLNSKNITEEVIADKCATIQTGLSITKQAIQDRLKVCKPFLKDLTQQAFSLIYSNALEDHSSLLLTHFSDVKILDATTISLPDNVADDYRGMGGRNSKAALKVQALYSGINHSITHFDITSGVTHDTGALPWVIEELAEKELFLADLGYFDTEHLEKIGEKNFFISRIKTNLKVFKIVSEKCCIYEQVDMTKLLKTSIHSIDQEFYIGSDSVSKLKVRLVGIKLPDEVAYKRIQKAIMQNGGKDITRDKRERLHWNLMITNVDASALNTKIIIELYRMRWQIELLFKVLKGTLSLDKIHAGKTKYVEAILYGRLLGALLTMPLYDCIDQTMFLSKGRRVSIQRFYTLLQENLYSLYRFNRITIHIYRDISEMLLRIGKQALHEQRLRQTTYSSIESMLDDDSWNGKK